jgi:hypothetical protein
MNALRVPYEAHTSAVGFASEGSACLREAASVKAGPTKLGEDPRLRAVMPAYRRQALRRAGPEPSMVQGRHGLQPVEAPFVPIGITLRKLS